MYKLELQDRIHRVKIHKIKDLQTYLHYFAVSSIQVSQAGKANFAKFKIVFLTQEQETQPLCRKKWADKLFLIQINSSVYMWFFLKKANLPIIITFHAQIYFISFFYVFQ